MQCYLPEHSVLVSRFHEPDVVHTTLVDVAVRLPSVQEKGQESPILLLQFGDNTALGSVTGHSIAVKESLLL